MMDLNSSSFLRFPVMKVILNFLAFAATFGTGLYEAVLCKITFFLGAAGFFAIDLARIFKDAGFLAI